MESGYEKGVGNILDKFRVKNRTEAVCYAFRRGWIRN
jgi:DNA-binding NarL/FixJ family response regulator